MRCEQCHPSPDYTPAELTAHAAELDHPLCLICATSLPADQPQVCHRCLQRTRGNLDDIVDAHTELRAHDRPTGSRHVFPGGDITVMLAGGSRGLTQIRGALTSDGQLHDEHAADEHAGDAQSVAFALARWQDDWLLARGEPAAFEPAANEFHAAALYLGQNMRWAANSHAAFDEFATDLQQLRYAMLRALGWLDTTVTGAPCLHCSTPGRRVDLERVWTDEGLADVWCCPRCGQTHTQAQYVDMIRTALDGPQRGTMAS